MDLEAAYQECERITWSQARNFAYGIRLLPQDKRRALAAVYAFARRIDDIGDGTLPPEEKLRQLEIARTEIPNGAPGPDDPVLVALADAGKHFAIPMAAFGELIDGCVLDVNGAIVPHLGRPLLLLPLRGGLDRPAQPRRVRRDEGPGKAVPDGR